MRVQWPLPSLLLLMVLLPELTAFPPVLLPSARLRAGACAPRLWPLPLPLLVGATCEERVVDADECSCWYWH